MRARPPGMAVQVVGLKPKIWNKNVKGLQEVEAGLAILGFLAVLACVLTVTCSWPIIPDRNGGHGKDVVMFTGVFCREVRRLSVAHFTVLSCMAFLKFNLIGWTKTAVLSNHDRVRQAILNKFGKNPKLSAGILRNTLTNMRHAPFRTDLSSSIKTQLARLQEVCLVRQTDEIAEPPVKRRRSDGKERAKPKRKERMFRSLAPLSLGKGLLHPRARCGPACVRSKQRSQVLCLIFLL